MPSPKSIYLLWYSPIFNLIYSLSSSCDENGPISVRSSDKSCSGSLARTFLMINAEY